MIEMEGTKDCSELLFRNDRERERERVLENVIKVQNGIKAITCFWVFTYKGTLLQSRQKWERKTETGQRYEQRCKRLEGLRFAVLGRKHKGGRKR